MYIKTYDIVIKVSASYLRNCRNFNAGDVWNHMYNVCPHPPASKFLYLHIAGIEESFDIVEHTFYGQAAFGRWFPYLDDLRKPELVRNTYNKITVSL